MLLLVSIQGHPRNRAYVKKNRACITIDNPPILFPTFRNFESVDPKSWRYDGDGVYVHITREIGYDYDFSSSSNIRQFSRRNKNWNHGGSSNDYKKNSFSSADLGASGKMMRCVSEGRREVTRIFTFLLLSLGSKLMESIYFVSGSLLNCNFFFFVVYSCINLYVSSFFISFIRNEKILTLFTFCLSLIRFTFFCPFALISQLSSIFIFRVYCSTESSIVRTAVPRCSCGPVVCWPVALD